MLSPVLVEAPAVYPVSLDEAKAHLRVTSDEEDALVEGLIAAASVAAERRIQSALITQTWRVDRGAWAFPFRLPIGPVREVVSVGYFDAANEAAVLSPSAYSLHADALGAALHFAGTASTPSLYSRPDAVRVTFTAGYGDEPSDVPAPIRQAILLMVGSWYEHREESVIGATVAALPRSVAADALLTSFRRYA